MMKKLLFAILALTAFAACRQEKPLDDVPEYPGPIEQTVSRFSFNSSDNKGLVGDIYGVVGDSTIIVRCTQDIDKSALIPTIEGDFGYATIEGERVYSHETAIDFNGRVKIVLDDYIGGEKKEYSVYVYSHNLIPQVYINTTTSIVSREEYVSGTMKVENCPQTGNFEVAGKARGRGNATFLSYPKKSYRFKAEEQVSVAGLPKNKDWVFLAEYCDKSLLRTTYMNYLGEAAGCEWTPKSTHVDLYLNGYYNGTYCLSEQVEQGKHKIDVEKDGFIIENDNYYSWEPVYFSTKNGLYYTFKYPEDVAKNDDNYTYIKDFMNKMESALKSSNFKDPENGYRKYLDPESFAKWYLVMELLGDHDPNFFYALPTRGGKLKMYPVWDAEWTLGIASAGPNGWQYYPEKPYYTETSEMYRTRRYFAYLFKDPYFVKLVYREWTELKKNLETVKKQVQAEADNIKYSQEDNFRKWPILGKPVSVNIIFFDTWQEEVDYAAKWFDSRINWFDGYITELYQKAQ